LVNRWILRGRTFSSGAIMIDKIKVFFSSISGILMTVLGFAGAVLFFWNRGKQSDIEALQAKLETANTQKQVDVIDAKVQQQKEQVASNAKELEKVQEAQKAVDAKREDIKNQNPSEKEILDYWNH
jgi:hypothetical protein